MPKHNNVYRAAFFLFQVELSMKLMVATCGKNNKLKILSSFATKKKNKFFITFLNFDFLSRSETFGFECYVYQRI